MNIRLLNFQQGIGSCGAEDIHEWVNRFGRTEDVAFFYLYQRDFIVLNEDNPNFELYKGIVEQYEGLSDLSKRELAEKCKSDFPKVIGVLKFLDYINRIRRKLYRHMKERAA